MRSLLMGLLKISAKSDYTKMYVTRVIVSDDSIVEINHEHTCIGSIYQATATRDTRYSVIERILSLTWILTVVIYFFTPVK